MMSILCVLANKFLSTPYHSYFFSEGTTKQIRHFCLFCVTTTMQSVFLDLLANININFFKGSYFFVIVNFDRSLCVCVCVCVCVWQN